MKRTAPPFSAIRVTAVRIFFLGLVLLLGLLPCRCRKRYSIAGSWHFSLTACSQTFTECYAFVGDSESGNIFIQGRLAGTYTCQGRSFQLFLSVFGREEPVSRADFKGYFAETSRLTGTFSVFSFGENNYEGTFRAER